MSNTVNISICIPLELLPVVKELQQQRVFSKFVQDMIRSKSVELQKESLGNKLKTLDEKMNLLEIQKKDLLIKIDEVKQIEDQKQGVEILIQELKIIKEKYEPFKIYESISQSKWPKPMKDLHFRKLHIINELKNSNDFNMKDLNLLIN
jgi:hypothetical protein